MTHRTLPALLVSLGFLFSSAAAIEAAEGPPFLATGVRVGEVGPEGAIVWIRLTAEPERNQDGMTREQARDRGGTRRELPDGVEVEDLLGACPPTAGAARVVFAAGADLEDAEETSWRETDVERDGVIQIPLEDLGAGTLYHYRVETRAPDGKAGATFTGSFRTAPPAEEAADVVVTVVTGMMTRDLDHPEGFHIYRSMGALEPDFFVATGDTVYYDSDWPAARGAALARFHWHRMYSLPRIVEFHRSVPGYWIKDDHDTLDNDCWPGKVSTIVNPLTFKEGQRIFREQVPMGRETHRTVRWGKHLQVWFVEGRDFRSPNRDPDGPGKTIWGREQLRWLQKTLLESTATFRVLVSATPIVGPDRPRGKNDNHSNEAFAHEGNAFRSWVREHLPDRFYVVCGDRHWQYHSVHPETGVQEFSCGPASDEHAGGTPGLDPEYHRFHRVGGGFLSVRVSARKARPAIAFRFHGVGGDVVHEYREAAFEKAELRTLEEKTESALETPLYRSLLEEARGHLERRAEEVAALTEPGAIAARRESIREKILDSFGGFPEKTPLKARVVGRVEREDHVMEKVIYESLPGFHVTANLYLPKSGSAPYPVVLFPCGHSSNGKAGSSYQTAGQEFARRGLATFIYDPIGQGERYQFLNEDGKPIIGGTTEHTVTGTCALLVGSNTAEVIIRDGIRGVDYLETRPDLDVSRLGCSGNSGGGTQTSYLMALEPRIRAAAPSCYLTTFERLLETIGPQDAEQNFTGFIEAGLDHADFVIAFSPKPALICAASRDFFDITGTWTTFREAKRIYGRLGRPELVDLIEVDATHGYHPRIRQRVGRFFEQTLLGRVPQDIRREVQEGTVYPDAELACTDSGQVLTSLGGRNVADLWRAEESRLRPVREERFRTMDRPAWLAEVRSLAGMEDGVPPTRFERVGRIHAPDVLVEKSLPAEGIPAPVLAFRRADDEDPPDAIEVLVLDGDPADHASRLAARARSGETIVVLSLPGYGETEPNASRGHWGSDWKAAFLAFHLGKSLAGLRADVLRGVLAAMRERLGAEVTIDVTATGRACIPALLAVAMEPGGTSLRLEGGLDSWSSIVEAGLHEGRLGNVVPAALTHFDLPLLREAIEEAGIEVAR